MDQNTLIIERQWDSLAVEATYEKVLAMPEYQPLEQDVTSVVQSSQTDVFTPLS